MVISREDWMQEYFQQIAHTNNKAVSNLIIIGTPNASSPIAQSSNICEPAVEDLKPGAAANCQRINVNWYIISWQHKAMVVEKTGGKAGAPKHEVPGMSYLAICLLKHLTCKMLPCLCSNSLYIFIMLIQKIS